MTRPITSMAAVAAVLTGAIACGPPSSSEPPAAGPSPADLVRPADMEHRIVAIEEGRFHGWPANNGVWQWGDEILVGFTQGDISVEDGHNITGRQDSLFARSTDGGETWTTFDPEDFLDDDNIQFQGGGKRALGEALDFEHEGFALRVFASGYHGNDDPDGGFYYSYDRGATWEGPFHLGELNQRPPIGGMILSPRTDYLVHGSREASIFISAKPSEDASERAGVIRTGDGGLSFDHVSWVTPEAADSRAIMSQTIQLDGDTLLTTHRRIPEDRDRDASIEAYLSEDRGATWRHLSTVKTMQTSSNPPATVRLADGRIACAYGDRHVREIRGRYSSDQGATWGPEFVIRDGFGSLDDDADLGYVRLVQRTDGKLVAMYYWATPEQPQQHIAASIWMP